ncbi:MAG: hypothetical protein JSR77_09485 [Planctomycetes bacterium]|nr:hypothetical protein [Planctomycetota bacterium]
MKITAEAVAADTTCPGGSENGTNTCSRVAAAAAALLRQCESFIRQVPDSAFASESALIRGGTLGKHLRHVLDHFAAVLWWGEVEGPISYDRRERNVAMETHRDAAIAAVLSLVSRLNAVSRLPGGTSVRVLAMISADGEEAELDSTLARELAFATHHAIHHAAMMKAIAAEFGVHAEPSFGKAPATMNFEHAH